MSDSGQLVSGMLPPPAPVMSLPRVSESIGLGPPPPQAQQPQAQPATSAPAMWRAPGPFPVHAPTGEMTMGARGPDTVVDAAGPAPAQQAGSSPIPPALQDYVKRTQTLEGNGKDPRSSAVGGFIVGTWLSLMKSHFPQQVAGMSEGQILALRSDAGLRDQAAAAYAADNAKILSAAGQPVTPATMRLSHFLGPKGALAVLTAPPNTPMSKLVSPDAIAANPGTLAGNTAGGVVELVSNQMNAETDHTKLPGLRHVAFGNFNEGAQGVLQGWETRRAEARGRYEQRAAKGEALENLGLAEMARWEQQSEKPPKNMHEAWSSWSGIAGVFALLGGLIGRNGTASIAAAGAMLQAANAADERGYDRAYAEWKDHVDRHAKLAEAFFREGHTIVDDARKSYDDINKELETFSTAWGVREKLDPESFYNKAHQNELKLQLEKITEAQNENDAIKDLMAKAMEANPKLTKGEAYVEAKRQMQTNSVGAQMMQFKMAEAANLMAQGVPKEEADRRAGLIPQLPKQAAGSEEAKFIESQVTADRAAAQSKGSTYTADDEQASRLKAREAWSNSAAVGRVSAGRPESAADRALQWKMDRAKELIAGNTPEDEAYRIVGLEPQQRSAGLENQFSQGRVAQAEAEAAANGQPFTAADRSKALADAREEWSRRTAAGRVSAAAPHQASSEASFTQDRIKAKESELGRPLNDTERADVRAHAHGEWAGSAQTGRTEAAQAHKPLSPATAERYGKIFEQSGYLPPGIARSSAAVAQIMNATGQTGSPGDFIANMGTRMADEKSLAAMTKLADAATSFENTAIRNFDQALKLSKGAIPTDWGPWLNRWIETGQTQAGNKEVPAYVVALLTAANEYAKVMTGATGAQSSTEGARREAAEFFSPYLSAGQIDAVVTVAKQEMENRREELYSGVDDIRNRLRHGGSREPMSRGHEPGTTGVTSQSGAAALPEGIPPGSTLIGTYKGKPAYETPDGRRIQVE